MNTTDNVFELTGNHRQIVKNGTVYKTMGGASNTESESGAACGVAFSTVANNFKFFGKSSPWPVGRTARSRVIARARGRAAIGRGHGVLGAPAPARGCACTSDVRRARDNRRPTTAAHTVMVGGADSLARSCAHDFAVGTVPVRAAALAAASAASTIPSVSSS